MMRELFKELQNRARFPGSTETENVFKKIAQSPINQAEIAVPQFHSSIDLIQQLQKTHLFSWRFRKQAEPWNCGTVGEWGCL